MAYLARYRGHSRATVTSDLRAFLRWCEQKGLAPLQAERAHIELFVRWMQEIQGYKPSTVGRRVGTVVGHRVLRVRGKGEKYALAPLPPAVGRAIDRAIDGRTGGPILRNRTGNRMDRNGAARRLHRLAVTSGLDAIHVHPHMLRHTFVTTMLDARVDLRDVQIAARHADPRTTMRYDRARKNLDRHPNYILAAFMASAT